MKYPSPSQSVQIQSKACFQLAELTTFFWNPIAFLAPLLRLLKKPTSSQQGGFDHFSYHLHQATAKTSVPTSKAATQKMEIPCGWKTTVLPWKKTTKMMFFEASMMCLLWSSPNTPFLRSTGRSKVVPNKTPDTNTRTPQYEQQNNIKWYQVGQGMARTCRMAVLATRMPPRRLRRGYAGTRTRIWN